MIIDQQSFRTVRSASNGSARLPAGEQPLRDAVMELADFRQGRSRLKPKDLVALLLCHGARAWRASQPVELLSIRVRSPSGRQAVRLSFHGAGL